MQNIFEPDVVADLTRRIHQLTPATTPHWGRMTVDQMLAHCNVSYEMVYDGIHAKPGALTRLLLKLFVKNAVVGPKPYPRNSPTAAVFKIVGAKEFVRERDRLIAYIHRVQQDGEEAFEGRESHSFGPLSSTEWNVLFYKHLHHHLTQFGV
jgi:hypothetical protein